MGCRKTLCQNCAFSRPLPRPYDHEQENSGHFWWAPSQARSPNLMMQEIAPDPNLTGVNVPNSTVTPAVKMQWCCLRPMFSNGGSITFVSPGLTSSAINQVRAAPLPKGKGYEDAEFARLLMDPYVSKRDERGTFIEHQLSEEWLSHGSCNKDDSPCPRSLCEACWETPGWRAPCQACKESFCFAHDFRNLNMRVCGYRDLATERAMAEERIKFKNIMVVWQRSITAQDIPRNESEELFRRYLSEQELTADSLRTLEAIIPLIKWPLDSSDELCRKIDLLTRRRQTISRSKTLERSQRNDDNGPEDQASPKVGTEALLEVCVTRWQGCGSAMCPKTRAIGDHRPRCTAATQQCVLCDVHVCPECLVLEPACDCSYCKDHYRCPNCFHFQKDLCKKAEEEEERRKEEEEAERRKVEASRMLEEADELAAAVGEFINNVLGIDEASRIPGEESSM